jgi:hypothetical protein
MKFITNSRSYFATDGQSVSQSVCFGVEPTMGHVTRYYFLPERCCLKIAVSFLWRRPLWREDGSAVCSAITQWSESRRTRDHTLLSPLRLPQPGGPSSRIYIPQEQGSPVIPRGTGFPPNKVKHFQTVWDHQGDVTSRLPHFLDNWITDGGEVVSLDRRPHFNPRKCSGTYFHSTAGRIRSIKKSNYLIRHRTRDIPAYSIVSQSTTLQR